MLVRVLLILFPVDPNSAIFSSKIFIFEFDLFSSDLKLEISVFFKVSSFFNFLISFALLIWF